MTAFAFLILAFAAYRGARAVALDSITEPFRDWVGVHGPRKLGELVTCGFCVSFWTAGLAYLVYALNVDDELGWLESPTEFWPSLLGHALVWWAIAGWATLLTAVDSFLLREAPPEDDDSISDDISRQE